MLSSIWISTSDQDCTDEKYDDGKAEGRARHGSMVARRSRRRTPHPLALRNEIVIMWTTVARMARDGVRVRAAVCRAPGEPLSIEDVVLEPPQHDEVRVAVDAVAICHSDLSYIDGHWATTLPAVFGHEAVGRVVECGPGVTLPVGTRVVITLVRHCSNCRSCLNGRPATCEQVTDLGPNSPLRSPSGEEITRGLRCGAFAEQVVVHRSQLVPVDDSLSDAAAALLACGVITGVGAVLNTDRVAVGDSVVVIGCGGVGLNVVQGAVLAGAYPIVAVDASDSKSEIAVRLGASHFSSPSEAADVVTRATNGRGADHVFVATGAPAAFRSASDLVAVNGSLVIVGMPPDGTTIPIDPSVLAGAGRRILGSKMGSSDPPIDIPELVDHARAGDLELEALISDTFTLDEIESALDGVRRGSALRNVVVIGGRHENH